MECQDEVRRAELCAAVERALELADELRLHVVGIGLDTAKTALGLPMRADEIRLRGMIER